MIFVLLHILADFGLRALVPRPRGMANDLRLSAGWSGDVLYFEVGGGLGSDDAISGAGYAVRAVIVDRGELDHVRNNGWHHVLLLSRTSCNHNGHSRLHRSSLPPSIQSVVADATFLGLLKVHRTLDEALASARNLKWACTHFKA